MVILATVFAAAACGPQAPERSSSASATARSCAGCHDSYAYARARTLTSTVISPPPDVHHEAAVSCVDCHGIGATQGAGVILSRGR